MHTTDRKRLDSWGEIAQYLRRDITTVKRWEKDKGLPVHRLPGGKRQPVFAYQDEIDEWSSGGKVKGLPTEAPPHVQEIETSLSSEASVPVPHPWTRYVALTIAALLTGTILILLFLIFAPAPQLRVVRYVPLTSDIEDKGGPLLTDGVRVYFLQKSPSGTALAAVAVGGGGTDSFLCQCAMGASTTFLLHVQSFSGTDSGQTKRRVISG